VQFFFFLHKNSFSPKKKQNNKKPEPENVLASIITMQNANKKTFYVGALIHVFWPWKFKKLLYAHALERVRRSLPVEEEEEIKCLITWCIPAHTQAPVSDAITQYLQ
jgi:hypothetical protein